MLGWTLNLLVTTGACILIASLIPVRRLISQPLPGTLRREWNILAFLIVLFIVGYAGYGFASWENNLREPELIVPVIFFFGACFVWLVSTLSLRTVDDVKRVDFLEKENITDPLLNVFNRRYLERRLDEEFSRARRERLELAVLMIDIDHFKRVNDAHGHPCGDQALRQFAALLKELVRISDVLARYGGEEFMIIMPHGTLDEAREFGERLRQRIEAHQLSVRCQPGHQFALRVTASIGIACLDPDVENPQQLIRYADRALYRAKHDGRNRVAIYHARSQPPEVSTRC